MSKRGPKKHLKRINAPKHWMLSKLGGIFAPKPSCGPHRLRECVPLSILLRNKLKLALNSRETKLIVKSHDGNIAIDGKIRKDVNYPVGFMDVVTLIKAKLNYRLLYDVKGRFGLVKLNNNEAEWKLCRIKSRAMGPKGIPYIVTHDGRTIRFPNPKIKRNDTVKLNLKSNEIIGHYKFAIGAHCMITSGNNIGRVGTIIREEKHPGSYEIIHIKDNNGVEFSTRLKNVFVTGSNQHEVQLLKRHSKISIINERNIRHKRKVVIEGEGEGEEEI